MKFQGYRRPDGSIGVRNTIAIISAVNCMNEATVRIAGGIEGATALPHIGRCAYLGEDQDRLHNTLVGFGCNPNVAGVLVVGLGCEASPAEKIAAQISKSGKPTYYLTAENEGGFDQLVEKGRITAEELVRGLNDIDKEEAEVSELTVAIKCGGSDTTSGIASNVVSGSIADRIISAGGTVIFTETAEVIGAEHILARRASSSQVANMVLDKVKDKEQEILAMGVDLRNCEPTPGNIQGGLTTIEEKSLGSIVKGGTSPLRGVLEWGQRPETSGLFFMDGPAHTAEICSGFASAGAHLMIFSLGGGLPAMLPMTPALSSQFPIMPVIKLTGNPKGYEKIRKHIDIYVGTAVSGQESISEASARAYTELLKFISEERLGVTENYTDYSEPLNIYFKGPLV